VFDFLKKVMSGASQESSKRFIGVVCMLLFGFLYIELIVLLPFILLKVVPASQTTINLYFDALKVNTYYAFLIISFAIGAVMLINAVEKVTDVLTGNAIAAIVKAKEGVPDTVVKNENVEQQNVSGRADAKSEQPTQNLGG
jgi:hypothetical protein